jgi:hypothetical protein
MKILSGTIIILVLLILIVISMGYSAPLEYSDAEVRVFDDSAQKIWEALTDIALYPEHKRDVVNIEILEKTGKTITKWRENTKFGGYRVYEVLEKKDRNILALEMSDSRDTLKGVWTYALRQEEIGTRVTISEESTQSHVFWRGLRVLSGRDSFIDHEFKWLQVSMFRRILYE